MSQFDSAKIRLPDGRIGYDALKIIDIPVEGINLKDYRNHKIVVNTKNTRYVITTRGERTLAQAFADDKEPRFLSQEQEVRIHGSTYGGSMIRLGFIGVGMHLELSAQDDHYEDMPYKTLTTTAIANIQVRELPSE